MENRIRREIKKNGMRVTARTHDISTTQLQLAVNGKRRIGDHMARRWGYTLKRVYLYYPIEPESGQENTPTETQP